VSNLLDFCRMTSSTGGTGALTCTAQTGYPAVSDAITGARFVNYSIAEYTASAKVQLSKAETGIGSYVASTGVLTRTKILSTWDGTDYRPLYGTATAPTALSFGSTSANIDITVSPIAGTTMPALPFVYGSVASVASGLGPTASNFSSAVGSSFLTSGNVYYLPYYLPISLFVASFTFREVTGLTGGSPTMDCAVYEISSDGTPGKRLVNFTQKTGIGTADTTYTSTALATPIFLPVGWYYVALLWLAAGASGSMAVRASTLLNSGPQGMLWASNPANNPPWVTSQTALNDPATAPNGISAQTSSPIVTFS